MRFAEKFADPLIVILLVAGVLSIVISSYEYWGLQESASVFFEPVGIFVAIFLATGMAFLFEAKAEREFALLNQVNDEERVRVIRSGEVTEVMKRDIVVGDVVIVETGAEIPADGQLLEATMMSVDESSLTGEPVCEKSTDGTASDGATYPADMVLRGTKVMEGHGMMKVSAVGDATECGRVMEAVQIDNSVRTPLNEQLDRLGSLVSKASYSVAVLVVAGRLLTYFIHEPFDWITLMTYLLQTVMIAVTLIVVAVPEGLPMAVTLSLAFSMRRMLKTNNLVRKLHACETMGAATVICTDKTGTLTQNQMRVHAIEADETINEWRERLYEHIAVNSTAYLEEKDGSVSVLGNPTEGALLLWLREQGADRQALRDATKVVAEQPFSTERKYMSTTVESRWGTTEYLKGAPEIVMTLCPATAATEAHRQQLATWQQQGMRTLALAFRDASKGADNPFTLQAIVAIADPVRDDVPAAVRECIEAGIDVKMVTGDTPATAREIARQVGLLTNDNPQAVITGPEVEALTDGELEERAKSLKIIARARPMDKKRLVEALQRQSQVVAVTGDGTNDAPALKAAHVGLSMGDGTAVAKEASDITIIDNSFSSIGKAVMWGRSLYRNIQRFILFQLTVNVAACLIVLAGAFMGTAVPLTVTQMLWVNLIMDTFAAMALATLPPTQAVMQEKPRNRQAFIIEKGMARQILTTGGLFFAILIVVLYRFEHNGWTALEQTRFFTIFVMMQFWNLFNARAYATGESALHIKGCRGFNLVATLIVCGQVLIVNIGGQMFNVEPMPLMDWIVIIFSTSAVLWIGEIYRKINNRKSYEVSSNNNGGSRGTGSLSDHSVQ